MLSTDGSTQLEVSMFTGNTSAEWQQLGPVLEIAWLVGEPERIGEVFLPPGGREPEPGLIGRGGAQPDDAAVRLLPIRQRPGSNVLMAALGSKNLSRRQLLVKRRSDGRLDITNVGRLELTVRGDTVDSTVVGIGDVIVLGKAAVLQVVQRPDRLYTLNSWDSARVQAFGGPDEFGIVGASPLAWSLRDSLAFCAGKEGHVLLTGESGTGKELAARAVHGLSGRGGALISRNAATLPPGLIDAELFGNTRNYPNPGMRERPGLIGEANGGTLFLDEVGELGHELQAHLLRVLDSGGEYSRLGESTVRRSDFTLVAATNRSVKDLKHDLAARLIHRVHVPTLDERRSDLPLLIRHILSSAADKDPSIASRFFDTSDRGRRRRPRIDVKLVEALLRHRYSTHVRELHRLLWMSMAGSRGQTLRLVEAVQESLDIPQPGEARGASPVDEITAEQITEAMERHQGVQARVWKELGLKNRFQLRRLIKKFGLATPAEELTTAG